MDEFDRMADQHTLEEFQNLAKISEAMTEDERARYAETNPIRIWMVAGPSEDLAIAISLN